MSLLGVVPELLESAAADLKSIGSELNAAHSAAAVPTTGIAAAGADEVSAAVAALFSGHGQGFQALSAQAGTFHQQFVQALSSSAGSYLSAEAANVSPLQAVEQAASQTQWFSPWQILTGRPLVGNGANGAAGTGAAGKDGGWLAGNGGNGGSAGAGNAGGAGGAGGLLTGNGGNGGQGGANAIGGAGGNAGIFGTGGTGGAGGATGPLGFGGPGGSGGKLFGATGAFGPAGAGVVNGTAPLQVNSVTEPVTYLSVNGGPGVPVLVDTGSTGLVIPLKAIGGLPELLQLGLPVGVGTGAYSGGLTYFYLKFDATLNFGNGIPATHATPVDVVVASFPGSFSSFVAPDGATGILGVGANANGPNTTSPLTALPSTYNQGVLINEPGQYLQFGANPLTPVTSTLGAPISSLKVSYDGGTPQIYVPGAYIDSGGVYGTIPTSVVGNIDIRADGNNDCCLQHQR